MAYDASAAVAVVKQLLLLVFFVCVTVLSHCNDSGCGGAKVVWRLMAEPELRQTIAVVCLPRVWVSSWLVCKRVIATIAAVAEPK